MVDLAEVGRNLLSLEINTIVSDGITAERMPSDGQALIRIAQLYKLFLMEVLIELAEAGGDAVAGLPRVKAANGTSMAFVDWDVSSGGMRTFEALRQAAHACRSARAAMPRPNAMRSEHDAILVRVAGTCSDVQALLRGMKLGDAVIDTATVELAEDEGIVWPVFNHDTLLQLRRIWETGVDVVVLQTVVRLDGGVTTRVLDGWDTAGAAPLQALHYQAVDIALQRWNLLVQTAGSLAGFFLGIPQGPDSVRNGRAAPLGGTAPNGQPASASRDAAVVPAAT